MNKTHTVYVTPDHNTDLIWSNFRTLDHLSIQDACIAAERAKIEADRAARAAGAFDGTWSVNW